MICWHSPKHFQAWHNRIADAVCKPAGIYLGGPHTYAEKRSFNANTLDSKQYHDNDASP